MPSELRQRKKGDQESKDKKNDVDKDKKTEKKPEKPVKTESKSSKWSLLWYLISPCFACYFTMKADEILDGAIARTQNRIDLQRERIDQINTLWSPEEAEKYLTGFDDLEKTILEMEEKMKEFGDEVFLKFGDPFSRNEHAKRLLKELEEIKATEDNYYIELKKTQKDKAETPSFMQIINMHTEGLTKNLRAFQEVYEDYDKTLKDNDLGAIYVNLTIPIQQLKDDITKTVDNCRDIGSNRYITEYWLQNMEDRIDLAHKAVKNGILDDIPEWPQDKADDLDDLAKDVKNLEKDLSEFQDYHQMIRDNYEQTIRNDRRGRNMEIEIDEKYQTPAEYKKMIENMEKWASMPDMRDLVAFSRTLAKKANGLLQVDCEHRQRDLIALYREEIKEQEERLEEMTEYMTNTDLKNIFKKVVVDEITKKQEGLTRFINQMRYQITKAEEKWANLYYDFLRGQKAELLADKDDKDNSKNGIEIVEDPEIMRKLAEDQADYERAHANDNDEEGETMTRVF